ncbi:MAG: FeoA family protein [Crocinitomicaceae bacterium]|nr:FeoA family protein [Crocinitomicaceae bacterium]
MVEQLPLSKIQDGESVIIRSIDASALKVKLMEMGLIEGKCISVLFRAPLGDPIAIDIEGYVLSLRKDEACMILVEPQKQVHS